MANYYGPLAHYDEGGDVSVVVDPRFGTSPTPTQPLGWAGGGGGGGDEGALLTGPFTDWGQAVNSALASNSVVRIASELGDLPLKTGIVIPSNRTLEMGHNTRFSITNDHETPPGVPLRLTFHPMIRTAGTPEAWSENIVIRGVNIDGSQAAARVNPNPYFGIAVFYSRHVLVEDCVQSNLQYNTSGTAQSYGIGASWAEHVNFVRCRAWGNGYQNFTTFDEARGINWTNCFSGSAWRTGFQIHRNASDVRVINLVVHNADPYMHACVTMHGQGDGSAIKRVTFIGLDIKGEYANPAYGRGGVQCVGTTDDLLFIGGRIRSAGAGMYLKGHNIRVVGMDIEAANSAFTMADNDTSAVQGSSAGKVSVTDCRLVTSSPTLAAVSIVPTYGTIDDFRVANCDIEAGGGAGIQFAVDSDGAHLSGNRIRTTGAGMDLIGSGMAYGNDLTGTTGITGGAGFTLANNVGA